MDKLREAFALYPHIIHWTADGVSFRVNDVRAFESEVLADEKVGFRCSTYVNWARSLRNHGFEAVKHGKGRKSSSSSTSSTSSSILRVWRHMGGQFRRGQPGHLHSTDEVIDVPVTKRCKTESDVPLVSGTLVVSEADATEQPPQLFPIEISPESDHFLTGERLSFGSSATVLESDRRESTGSCSYSLSDNEHDSLHGMAIDDISALLSRTDSDLERQLQLCQEDYVHGELSI